MNYSELKQLDKYLERAETMFVRRWAGLLNASHSRVGFGAATKIPRVISNERFPGFGQPDSRIQWLTAP